MPSTRGEKKKRSCEVCKVALPKSKYDPHHICISCRGGECRFGEKYCDFCKDWPKSKWDSLILCVTKSGEAANPRLRPRRVDRHSEDSRKARLGLALELNASVAGLQPQEVIIPPEADSGDDDKSGPGPSPNG